MNIRKTFAAVAVAGAIALSGLACGGTGVTELEDRMLFFQREGEPERHEEPRAAGGVRLSNLH